MIPIKLSNLPLKPSTLSLLSRRGFSSTADIYTAKTTTTTSSSNNQSDLNSQTSQFATAGSSLSPHGGISNLATELDLSLQEAVLILREVQSAHCSVVGKRGEKEDTAHTNRKNNTIVLDGVGNSGCTTPLKRKIFSNENSDADNDDFAQAPHASSQKSSSYYKKPQTAASLLRQLKQTNHTTNSNSSSSSSIFQQRPLLTFVKTIDTLLGGGIHPHELTEIAGLPGVGKTQLTIQLCVNTTIPYIFGGVEGQCIYIDCEGSFCPERCWDMATALVDHVSFASRRRRERLLAKRRREGIDDDSDGLVINGGGTSSGVRDMGMPKWFTPETILDSIHCLRIHDEACLLATIMDLGQLIERIHNQNEEQDEGNDGNDGQDRNSARKVKLLVIDSIAFHFRCSTADYKTRTKSLAMITSHLSDLASKYNIAVVVVNQMTTKMSSNMQNGLPHGDEGDESRLIPALGESWAHSTTTRLLLLFDHNSMVNPDSSNVQTEEGTMTMAEPRRICRLVKSPHRTAGEAHFNITQYGVRDCP